MGITVLVVGLIIGGIFFAVGLRRNAAPAATPTPTPSAIATPSLIVTETPASTPTKAPTPTMTKKPTPTQSNTPVPTPTPTPGVINIETSVTPTTSTLCTQQFTFTAKIYTNGAMTVKYKWLRSDVSSPSEQTLTYTGAGMQTVTTEWTRGPIDSGTSVTGWERIEITSPGSALSNKAEFTLTCP